MEYRINRSEKEGPSEETVPLSIRLALQGRYGHVGVLSGEGKLLIRVRAIGFQKVPIAPGKIHSAAQFGHVVPGN